MKKYYLLSLSEEGKFTFNFVEELPEKAQRIAVEVQGDDSAEVYVQDVVLTTTDVLFGLIKAAEDRVERFMPIEEQIKRRRGY
jgi:phage terminase large subunit-like protein